MTRPDPTIPFTPIHRSRQSFKSRGRWSASFIGTRASLTAAATVAVAALIGFSGCASTSSSPANNGYASGAMSEPAGAAAESRTSAALEEVERQYLIGPTAAREMGFRIDWQYTGGSRAAKIFEVDQDSLFLLDARNVLTRIDREKGTRIWGLPVAEQVLDIQGVNYVPDTERVYLPAGGSVLVLDAANGSQVGRQTMGRIANTPAVRFGQFLIYGSRSGQVIWHSFPIGYQWNGYQISHSIKVPLQLVGDLIVVAGADGRLCVLHAPDATMRWSKRLIAPTASAPVVAGGVVYAASLDQHLWAYDLSTGHNLWRYLSDHPITDSPTVIGEMLYQQIPQEGLFAFEANPQNAPGGKVVWRAQNVRGNVIGSRNGRLFVWNAAARQLILINERNGGVINTINLPRVHEVRVDSHAMDEFYAFGEGGRVIRLIAR